MRMVITMIRPPLSSGEITPNGGYTPDIPFSRRQVGLTLPALPCLSRLLFLKQEEEDEGGKEMEESKKGEDEDDRGTVEVGEHVGGREDGGDGRLEVLKGRSRSVGG